MRRVLLASSRKEPTPFEQATRFGWMLAVGIGIDRQRRWRCEGQRLPQTTSMQYDSELGRWVVQWAGRYWNVAHLVRGLYEE